MSSVLDNPVFIAAFAVAAVVMFSLLRPRDKPKEAPAPAPAKSERGLPAAEEDAPAAAASESVDATEATATGKKRKKKKSKAKKKAAASTQPESEPGKTEVEAAATDAAGGGGGKKKKKKKAGGATNGAASKGTKATMAKPAAKAEKTKEDSDSEDERVDTIRPPAAPVKQAAQLPKTEGLTKAEKKQQLRDLNDGWEMTTKKKKKKPAGQKKAASQTGNASDAPISNEVKISVTVEAKKIGIVIGPKGATMQSVQDATNTKIEINASKEANDRKPASVTITGKPADAQRAKKAIQEICAKGYTTLTQDAGFMENSISVHPQVLSELVGPGGRVIRAIQEKLSVKITIPSTDWKPNQPQMSKVQPARVGIAGDRDACKKAKEVIQAISQYHHHEVTHPGLTHEEVDVPPEFLHCVIGARGSEIRHIKGNYSCDVYIPNADSYSEYVVVVGRPVQVERAISHINKLMDRETERNERRYDDEAY